MVPGAKVRRLLITRFLAFFVALFVGLAILAPAAFAQEGNRKVKNRVDPTYPAMAKQMHLAGTVKVEVVITAAGAVKSTKVLGGHPLLAAAAEDAIKKWKFEAGPGETTEIIQLNFNLANQ